MSRKNEIHILWILLTMFPIHIFSQTTRFYSPDRELSSSLITQLYQDKRGFVWVATEDGLNRLDGSLITIYRKKNNDSTSLKNNYVRTIFEDSSGHFWIGCINGLQLYNRSTDSFREIVLKKENGIRSYPHFTSIIERRNGDIWMATSGSGVITFPKGSLQYSNEVGLNKNLCSLFLTSLYEDSKGRIWMGSENNGFCCYLPETNSFLQFSGWENEIRNQAVSSFCELPDGAILIGTLTGGLYKYTSGGVIQTIQYERTQHPLAIKSLFVCRDGKILVGTDGMGFKLFNLETDKLQDYKLFSTPFDFSRTNVYSILEDKDENIWVGIFQKGVLLMPNHSSYFRYYGNKSFEHNLIGANCVMSIYKSRNGRLLIGTDNDGLYVLDENAQSVKHYPSNNLPSSVLSTVMCIHEARDGSIWLGTYLNGLARFDVNTGRCIYYPNRMGNHPANDKVYTIAEATDGKLWIGTYGNGIFRFDPKSGKFDAHYSQLHGLSNNWVNFMAWDNNNRLWIATYKGLSCFDPAMETFTNYYEKANGLPSNVVSSIAVATGGDIWLGTDAGIARLNLETDNISIYTTADGLSNDMICGIVEDAQKNIWISTHSGISKYSVVEHDFINYYAADGLQSNEFRRGAAHKAPDGEVFFGGINGVTCFYPQEIGIKERELDVFITGFYLFDKKIAYGPLSNGVEILDTTIMDAKHIKLNADNNVFSFEFSTLDYNNVSGITYRYHMEHFDNAWLITPQGVRRVTYTNLDPGTYQFSVQACELGNCSDVKTVTITIRPYWYMSVVAKIVYVLLAMLLVYGIYLFIRIRNHHRQEMLRQQHMEQINEAKLQFFTDISHEIRTPMTLIIGPLKKLMSDQNTNSDLQKSYQLIYRNAQRILRLINQLMDIRKIDRGQMSLKFRETDMVGFVLDVMQAFNSLAEQKNIRFSFRHDMPVLKAWIDLNNFDKVLFNLLSNAFKFTPDGGNIDITLSVGNDNSAEGLLKHYFEIQVCDTGIGIDQSRIEKIFERFYQIDHDVIQAGSGTGVGLHLSRSLVHMLHGTLTAQNNVDASGSTFIVRLPMGNAHLQKNEIENISHNEHDSVVFHNDYFYEEPNGLVVPAKSKIKTKYRIILIDDETDIRNYIYSELSDIYHVSVAENGKEGLSLVLKENPDLVISDIIMDGMDGISLCKKLKSNVNTAHIPVILVTAKSRDEDRAKGLDIGADAYITKPFNPDILKKTVANVLENRERLKGKFASSSEGKIDKMVMKSSDEILIERVMKIINENISNPDLNVEMLSHGVGMSRVHMHRKLKELTNQSARDFIRTIRLKQAGNLLSDNKLTISEVAYAVGFSTLSHFSSCFRDFYGMTPKEYSEREFVKVMEEMKEKS